MHSALWRFRALAHTVYRSCEPKENIDANSNLGAAGTAAFSFAAAAFKTMLPVPERTPEQLEALKATAPEWAKGDKEELEDWCKSESYPAPPPPPLYPFPFPLLCLYRTNLLLSKTTVFS